MIEGEETEYVHRGKRGKIICRRLVSIENYIGQRDFAYCNQKKKKYRDIIAGGSPHTHRRMRVGSNCWERRGVGICDWLASVSSVWHFHRGRLAVFNVYNISV